MSVRLGALHCCYTTRLQSRNCDPYSLKALILMFTLQDHWISYKTTEISIIQYKEVFCHFLYRLCTLGRWKIRFFSADTWATEVIAKIRHQQVCPDSWERPKLRKLAWSQSDSDRRFASQWRTLMKLYYGTLLVGGLCKYLSCRRFSGLLVLPAQQKSQKFNFPVLFWRGNGKPSMDLHAIDTVNKSASFT